MTKDNNNDDDNIIIINNNRFIVFIQVDLCQPTLPEMEELIGAKFYCPWH